MNTIITLYDFNGKSIEIFELNGIVYFNPRHVAGCLELTDSAVRKAISKMNSSQVRKLKNSDVKISLNRTLNNAGENFLTESGFYQLAFRSDKEEAQEFTNWVTDTVLPQIRRTGGYIPMQTAQAVPMSDAEIMASALLIAQKTIQARDTALTTANTTIQQLQPKADYVDMVLNCKDMINVTQIAQDYGMSAIAFNKLLESFKIQYKRGDEWILYAAYKGLGWVGSTSHPYTHTDQTQGIAVHTKWTQKGRLGLYELLKEKGYIPVMESEYEAYKNGTN